MAEAQEKVSTENGLQVSFKSEPGLSRLESLPPEILQMIFQRTRTKDLMELRLTSKTMRQRIEGIELERFKSWKLDQKMMLKLKKFSDEVKVIKEIEISLDGSIQGLKLLQEHDFMNSLIYLTKSHQEIKRLHLDCKALDDVTIFNEVMRSHGHIIGNLNFNHCTPPHLHKDLLPRLELLGFEWCTLTVMALRSVLTDFGNNLVHLKLDSASIFGEGVFCSDMSLPRLKSLELEGHSNLTNHSLYQLLAIAPNLERLIIRDLSRLDFEGVSRACKSLLKMKRLDLIDCTNLTDQGLSEILLLIPNLKNLRLIYNMKISGERSSVICKSLPKLTSLFIMDCRNLTDHGLGELLSVLPNLQNLHLYLTDCPKISGKGVASFCKPMSRLVDLEIICKSLSSSGLGELFSIMPNLQSFHLDRRPPFSMSGVGVAHPSKSLQNLSKLNLTGLHGLTNTGLSEMLSFMPNIQDIVLPGTSKLTKKGMFTMFRSLQKLTTLGSKENKYLIDFARTLNSKIQDSNDKLCSIRKSVQNISNLRLSRCRSLTDHTLSEILSLFPNLQSLVLDIFFAEISLEGISKVCKSLPKVTSLELNFCHVTDKGLSELLSITPNLRYLEIRGTRGTMTGEGISHVCRSLPKLTILHFTSWDSLTDQGLSQMIALMPGLQKIILKYMPKISEEYISQLKRKGVNVKQKNF